MNIKKYFRLLLVGSVLLAGLILGIDSALASTEQKKEIAQEYQPDGATLANYDALKKKEARLEATLQTGGWVRHSYHSNSLEDVPIYRMPNAQFPSETIIETWFHFNTNGLVDRQITFITRDGKSHLSEIFYRGVYRSAAEAFAPLDQEPYSPSLYFYIASASPQATAKEGAQTSVNQEMVVINGKDIARFTVRDIFPAGMPEYSEKDAGIIGIMHVIYVDPETAQPLQIDNHFLLKDNNSRPFLEITQIQAERVLSPLKEVQWYFDNYDQLDWSSYAQVWSSK